jgi:beta-lactam-binding protein with PASTA domain
VEARRRSAPGEEDVAVRERLGSTARLALPALAVLALLVVVSRLVVTLSSLPSPTGASRSVVGVPDVVGRQLGEAQAVMRTAGLAGVAYERDPQGPDSVVVAQKPWAGSAVPRGSTVGFRTRAP